MPPILWDVSCPSCGAQVPVDARFCPSCGQPLHAHADERRVVTVVFGDLVGFTGMAELVDPEQVKNLVDRCFARLAADITSFGGRVDKIVGDAIVALFGAPVAHEDDAERAVRAALQMQETIARERPERGPRVQMRIGINTGEVLVGALRAGGDYTAMGDVVNTASRLQTAAAPGQVLVGRETYLATRSAVSYEPLGEIVARGRGAAVEAYAALRAVAPPGRRPRKSRTPLVGRDAEMGMMSYALGSAVGHRRPHLVLLVGEAGMGKSRLAEEVAAVAHDRHQAVVLEGRAVPYGEVNPWWPLAEGLRQSFGVEPGEPNENVRGAVGAAVAGALERPGDDREVERVTDGLLFLMGQKGALGEIDAQSAREEGAWAVRTYFEALASQRPLVVLLSDLQWADQQVLDLLAGLVSRLRRLPFVLLATGRPDLGDRWRPAPGRHNMLVLNLDPLEPDAVGRLVSSLLEHEPDEELLSLLQQRSGGNPFYLEELVALLTESGVLAEPRRNWDDAGRQVLALPATLRGLVAARLDALPAEDRDVLEDAAVLGRRGSLRSLVALSATRGEDDVRRRVESLAALELLEIIEDRVPRVGFRSDLVREVAYGTLTKAERARRHAAAATWLASRPETDRVVELRAHHLATAAELVQEIGTVDGVPADVTAEALDAVTRSAGIAEQRENHLVALQLYERALALLGDRDLARRHELLLGRAHALIGAGDADRVRDDLEEVLAGGDDRAVARALTYLGDLQRIEGDHAESLRTLEHAAARWREVGDRGGEAGALRRAGVTYMFLGDHEEAERIVAAARDAFHEVGDRRGEAWAVLNLARIAFVREDAPVADDRLAASAALFEEIGDWGGVAQTRSLLAWVRYYQGRRDEAESLVEATMPVMRERGDRSSFGMEHVLLGWLRLWRGRAAEAVELARTAQRMFEEMNFQWGLAQALGPMIRGLLATGQVAGARTLLEGVPHAAALLGGARSQATLTLLPTEIALQVGEPEQALAALEAASAAIPAGVARQSQLWARASAHVQLGRPDEAAAMLEPDRERGSAALLGTLALALVAAGRVDEARPIAAGVVDRADATYLDRLYAMAVLGCAAARLGDAEGVALGFARVEEQAGATDDRLTQAVLRRAHGLALEAVGDPSADAVLADARGRLDALDVAGTGWDTAFRHAVGTLPAPSVQAVVHERSA